MNKGEKLREMAYEFAAEICVNGVIDTDYNSEQIINLFSRAMQSYSDQENEELREKTTKALIVAAREVAKFQSRIEELEKKLALYKRYASSGTNQYIEDNWQDVPQTLTQEKDE